MSTLPLPPVRTMVLAAVFAAAVLLGVSSLIAWASAPLLRPLWDSRSELLASVGIAVNLVSHLAAIALTYLLFRRSVGRRAEMTQAALAFLVGYTALVLLISVYSAIGSRLTFMLSNAGIVKTQWAIIVVGVVIPLAIAAALFAYAGRRPASRS